MAHHLTIALTPSDTPYDTLSNMHGKTVGVIGRYYSVRHPMTHPVTHFLSHSLTPSLTYPLTHPCTIIANAPCIFSHAQARSVPFVRRFCYYHTPSILLILLPFTLNTLPYLHYSFAGTGKIGAICAKILLLTHTLSILLLIPFTLNTLHPQYHTHFHRHGQDRGHLCENSGWLWVQGPLIGRISQP